MRSSARAGEQALPPEQEYDYPTMLNKALPLEIRVLGWTDVAPDFNARHVLAARVLLFYCCMQDRL